METFHHDLKTHDRIKESTWTDTYGRFLAAAVAELEGSRPPANGYDLITRALAPWADGGGMVEHLAGHPNAARG